MGMDDGAILQKSSGEIMAVNPAAEVIFGLSAAQLIERSCTQGAQALGFVHQDETPVAWECQPATLAIQTGTPQRNVLMGVHRPNGTLLWLSVTAQALALEGEPGPSAVVQTFRDITQHRLTEQYEQFRSMAETSPDFIVRYDREGRHRYLNDRLLKQLGLASAQALIGKRPSEVWPDGRFAELEQAAARAVQSESQVDIEFVEPNVIGAPRYHQIYIVPERDVNGRVVGSISFGREITAIRENERKLKHFIDNLPGLAYTFWRTPDGHGCFPYVSPAIEEIYGLTPQDVKDDMMPIQRLAHPDDQARILAAITEAGQTMTPFRIESRVCRPGLPERWLDVRSAPDQQPDGSVLWHGIMLDITERKQAERERQANAHSFECMDRVNKAILGAADLDQLMTRVLDIVLAFFNCDRAFLLYPCDPDAPQWQVLMERTRPEYPGALASGMGAIPMDGHVAAILRTLLGAAGAVKFGPDAPYAMAPDLSAQFGVQSMLSMALFPKLDKPWQFGIQQCSHARSWSRNEEVLLQKIGHRLSDALTSWLMQRSLQASERDFRALAENLPDTLVRYDSEGRRTYVNPAMLREFSVMAEQMIGKTLQDANPTGMPLPQIYQRALAHTLATGERSEFEMQMPSPNENMRTGLCFIMAERGADGRITGAISIGHDITERKRNEAELERHRHHLEKLVEDRTLALSIAKETAETATRAKSHFLAAASHDLRQPLQAIGLFNQALAMTSLDERQKAISNHLAKSVKSLSELLNDLLDLSRLDVGIIEPHCVLLQAADLLEVIEVEFDADCRKKNLRLKLFGSQQNLVLFSDGNLLLTLLRNLVSNAVKYTTHGGILVGIRHRGDRALIQVWDTGVGIAPGQMDSIFEEYFQVGNPERDRTKGVGLGLSIVKRLCKLLGIELRVRSREGIGSVFELGVPLANASNGYVPVITTSSPREIVASNSLLGKRLVIVEDDAPAAEAISLALEMAGAQVTLFNTAEEALGCAQTMAADYYISDYRLPGMNGLQLLDAIQARSAQPIKAVLLTGNTSPDQVALKQCLRWKVLFKPVDFSGLLMALGL